MSPNLLKVMEWILVTVAVQTLVFALRPNRIMRGFVTRRVIVKIPPRSIWAPPYGLFWRMMLCGVLSFSVDFATNDIHDGGGGVWGQVAYTLLIVGVYLDDYVFGGEDPPPRRRRVTVRRRLASVSAGGPQTQGGQP